jgi:hypothetical protein
MSATPAASDAVSDVSDATSDVSDAMPDKSDAMPDKSNIVSDKSNVLSDVSDVVSDTSDVMPDTSDVLSDASDVMPDASGMSSDLRRIPSAGEDRQRRIPREAGIGVGATAADEDAAGGGEQAQVHAGPAETGVRGQAAQELGGVGGGIHRAMIPRLSRSTRGSRDPPRRGVH